MHICEYVLLYVDYTSVKLKKNDKSRLQILFIIYTISVLIKVTIIFHLTYCNRLNFSLFLPFINLFSAQNSDYSIKTQVTSHNHCNTPMASKFTLSKHQSKRIYDNLLCNLPPFFTANICLPPPAILATSLLFEHTRDIHPQTCILLFLRHWMLFPGISTWLFFSLQVFNSNVAFPVRPSLTAVFKIPSPSPRGLKKICQFGEMFWCLRQ